MYTVASWRLQIACLKLIDWQYSINRRRTTITALVYTQNFRTPTESTHIWNMGRNLPLTLLEWRLTTANCTEIHWSSNNGSTWTKSALYLIKKGPKSTLLPKWVDPLSENGFRRSFCSIFRVGRPITSSKLIHEGNPPENDCRKRLRWHSFDPLGKSGFRK